jgi:hypothetical protein
MPIASPNAAVNVTKLFHFVVHEYLFQGVTVSNVNVVWKGLNPLPNLFDAPLRDGFNSH